MRDKKIETNNSTKKRPYVKKEDLEKKSVILKGLLLECEKNLNRKEEVFTLLKDEYTNFKMKSSEEKEDLKKRNQTLIMDLHNLRFSLEKAKSFFLKILGFSIPFFTFGGYLMGKFYAV